MAQINSLTLSQIVVHMYLMQYGCINPNYHKSPKIHLLVLPDFA